MSLNPVRQPGVAETNGQGNNLNVKVSNLRVMNDNPVTVTQATELEHCFKMHMLNVQTSAAGYLVRNTKLSDGSRVRIISNSGLHYVMVWPEYGRGKEGVYRGFVLWPQWGAVADAVARFAQTILLKHPKDSTWKRWIQPYRPGRDAAIPYVTKTVRTAAPRRVRVHAEGDYFDVHSLWKDVVHKNGLPYFRAKGLNASALPILFEGEGAKKLLQLNTTTVLGFTAPATLGTLYSFPSFFAPVVSGYSFMAGVRYDAASAKALFLGYNVTAARALQTWRATIGLQIGTPFYTVALEQQNQLGVENKLLTSGGWDSTEQINYTAPRKGGPTLPLCFAMFWAYPCSEDPAGGLTGWTYEMASEVKANDDSAYYIYKHTETVSLPETLALYDDSVLTVERWVNTDTTYTSQPFTSFFNTWPHASPLYDWPGAGVTYLNSPSGNGPAINRGGMVGTACYGESSEELTHSDDAFCSVTISSLPHELHKATLKHANTRKISRTSDAPANPSPDEFRNVGGATSGMITEWQLTRAIVPAAHKDEGTFLSSAQLISRDYLYADIANSVFVWIEATASSDATGYPTQSGASTLDIVLRIQSPMLVASQNIYSGSFPAATLPLIQPTDVDMGTSSFRWSYVSPNRPEPVFAPPWQEQGLCPHIAYTVAGETGEDTEARFLFSIRLQLVKTERGPDELDPPQLVDTVQFAPYMLEQMLVGYGLPVTTVFAALEATVQRVDKSFPADPVLDGVEIPVSDTRHGHFYRT